MEKQVLKLIVAGGRDFEDHLLMMYELEKLMSSLDIGIKSLEIVHGGAKGADSIAKGIAESSGITHKPFPADWRRYRRAAGIIRNRQMAEYADRLLAFWDGKSPGTKNMIAVARELELPVDVVFY